MMQTIHQIGEDFIERSQTANYAYVSLSVNIRADAHRIVYALTIPEYMEAWMVIPGADRVTCVGEDRSEVNFRLDLCCSKNVHAPIHCHRILATTEHLKFAWRRVDSEGKGQSIVDIRIRQRKAVCIVSVRHTGFSDVAEATWHSVLWLSSLNKLRRLLEA